MMNRREFLWSAGGATVAALVASEIMLPNTPVGPPMRVWGLRHDFDVGDYVSFTHDATDQQLYFVRTIEKNMVELQEMYRTDI